MTSTATRNSALKALEGMREIVRHEMLLKQEYVENTISNQRLAEQGAICGGRKHCAIGSLWTGAGIKPKVYFGTLELPGTEESGRADFLRHRPGLRLAYDALNEAAEAFEQRHDLPHTTATSFEAPIERLFEGHWGDRLTKRALLAVISAAKRKVAKAS